MKYVYGAMLLHAEGKEVNETNLKKVMEATGEKSDETRIKALVASLDGVNIDEAIKTAAPAVVQTAPAAVAGTPTEEGGEGQKAKEKPSKEEEEKKEEEAATGLASLFG